MAVVEVGADELQTALAAGAKLIDVREPHEYDDAHVPGAILIPLRTVPEHIDEFRGASPAYVICHVGSRSMRVCQYLEQQGVEAINVAGGIVAWANQGLPVQ